MARVFDAFAHAPVPSGAERRYRKRNAPGKSPLKLGAREVARYDYGRGRIKVRYAWKDASGSWDKDFRWINKGPSGPILYRPPTTDQLRNAVVYVVEGEKDVDSLRDRGLVATCVSEGYWTLTLAKSFVGAKGVAVLRDYDVHGRRASRKGAGSIQGSGGRGVTR